MTTKPDDGGPAFPFSWMQESGIDYRPEMLTHPGMSMRDYFAGQAMIALMNPSWPYEQRIAETGLAAHCYMIADAMIAARQG